MSHRLPEVNSDEIGVIIARFLSDPAKPATNAAYSSAKQPAQAARQGTKYNPSSRSASIGDG